ncbi:MAG: hypothetical protein D6731_08485, partial [Planctomycetota bacterium]
MEGVIAAAKRFLADGRAVLEALAVDQRRAASLKELRSAFEDFRAGRASLRRLAEVLEGALWEETATAGNLWGFENEDERRFPTRLAELDEREPELDLGSVVAGYLQDVPRSDEDRVQQLLAFGELVAGLDARGRGERLGVGPAANFLTFAWHCLSGGQEPVFLYSSLLGVREAVARGLAHGLPAPSGDLEDRFRAFYAVARALEGPLSEAPAGMKPGWAVEHALAHLRASTPEGGEAPAIEAPPAASAGITIVRGEAPSAAPPSDEPSDEELQALIDLDPATLTPATARKRDRFLEIARRRVVHADTRLLERSGQDLAEVLPPDRVAAPAPPPTPPEEPVAGEARSKKDTRRLLDEVRKLKEETRHRSRAGSREGQQVYVSGELDEEPTLPAQALVEEFGGEVRQAAAAPPQPE